MTLHLQRLVYRALNPVYARDPLSGKGAQTYGGRFNAKGTPALYTSLTPETAIREANQVGTLQPTTLVAYQADITPILDGTDATALAEYGVTPAQLADPGWRNVTPAPTQSFAALLVAQGFAGMIVPSYAKGATPDARNLVLWVWGDAPPTLLRVIDDEGRLIRTTGA